MGAVRIMRNGEEEALLVSYWLVFILVFLSLCAREGKRARGNDGLSRALRRLYEFGSRNAKKDEEADEKGDGSSNG